MPARLIGEQTGLSDAPEFSDINIYHLGLYLSLVEFLATDAT